MRPVRLAFAVLAVPACAVAQPPRTTSPAPIEVSGPQFAALSVKDLSASVKWYRELFGLGVLFEAASPDSSTRVILLGNRNMRLELVSHREAKSISELAGRATPPDMVFGSAKIGFYVRDLDAALAALRARGAIIEGTWLTRPANVASTDSVWTRNLLARDNSGTYVQFFEWPASR
jgi:methylmalonyl-CoA/ethylmalonyl-CoA epimerase